MGDLIDLDALGVGPANPEVFKNTAYADGWNALLKIIKQAPVIDAAPVVHGWWVEYPVAHYFKCSKCKYIVPYKKAVRINEKQAYNYCPSCGAKMDGEGDAECQN